MAESANSPGSEDGQRRKSVAAEAVVQDGTKTAYWERLSYADQDEKPLGQGEEPLADNPEKWTQVKPGDRRSSGVSAARGGAGATSQGGGVRGRVGGGATAGRNSVGEPAVSPNDLPPPKKDAWQNPPPAVKEAPAGQADVAGAHGGNIRPHGEAAPPVPEKNDNVEALPEQGFGEDAGYEDDGADAAGNFPDEGASSLAGSTPEDGSPPRRDYRSETGAHSQQSPTASRHPDHSNSLTAPRVGGNAGRSKSGDEQEGWGTWIKKTLFGA